MLRFLGKQGGLRFELTCAKKKGTFTELINGPKSEASGQEMTDKEQSSHVVTTTEQSSQVVTTTEQDSQEETATEQSSQQ